VSFPLKGWLNSFMCLQGVDVWKNSLIFFWIFLLSSITLLDHDVTTLIILWNFHIVIKTPKASLIIHDLKKDALLLFNVWRVIEVLLSKILFYFYKFPFMNVCVQYNYACYNHKTSSVKVSLDTKLTPSSSNLLLI